MLCPSTAPICTPPTMACPEFLEPPPPPYEEVTTLKIMNIPPLIDQREFAARVDVSGFEDTYDFLYLPSDFRTGTPMGYAFINFRTVQACGIFVMKWQGMRLINSERIELARATHQGRDKHVALCSKQRIRNPAFRPIVFEDEHHNHCNHRHAQPSARHQARDKPVALSRKKKRPIHPSWE